MLTGRGIQLMEIGISGTVKIIDMWSGTLISEGIENVISVTLKPNSSALYKLNQ
jgi:hypothetical protein